MIRVGLQRIPKITSSEMYYLLNSTARKTLGYVSDIHLERNKKLKPRVPVHTDYLALCGDIGNPFHRSYEELLRFSSFNFDKTFLVSGNHEYDTIDAKERSNSFEKVDDRLRNICSKFNNVYFLNKDKATVEGHLVLGTTLWTPRNVAVSRNKSKTVHYNDVINRRINKIHLNQLEWLEKEIEKYKDISKIILTHHPPSYKMRSDKYSDSPANRLFYNNIDYLMNPANDIYAWLCGHSHCVYERIIGDTYVGINAYGYEIMNETDGLKVKAIYL